MVNAPSNVLEELLLDRIERELVRQGGRLSDRKGVRERLRAELARTELSSSERDLLAGGDTWLGGDPVLEAVSSRLESALRAGLSLARDGLAREGDALTLGVPRIVIASDDPDAPPETVLKTLERTLTAGSQILATIELDEEGLVRSEEVLVIASERSYTTLASKPDTLGMRSEVRFLSATENTLDLEITEIEVTEVAVEEVAELTERVSIAATELGGALTLGDRAVKGDLTGTVLDRKYVIEQKIGAGGFGAVYLAKHTALGSRVAVKVLNANAARAQGKDGFLEEARRLTKLKHENIVDWKDFGESEDGTLYFVMDFLEGGQELADVLKELRAKKESMPPERVADILLQILEALRAAHHVSADESILHLDMKPQNVFLLPHPTDPDRVRVKVIDFGIGQHVTRGEQAARPEPETDVVVEPAAGEAPTELETELEHDGSTIQMAPRKAGEQVVRVNSCTPEYAAPEQCAHLLPDRVVAPLDGRADLYAVGVMGYEMLTGRLHYPKPPNRRMLLAMHLDEPHTPLPVRGSSLRKGLCRFVERSIAQDPDKRFVDTREAHATLKRVVQPPVWQLVAKVSAALIVTMLGLVWAFGPDASIAKTIVDLDAEGARLRAGQRVPYGAGSELRFSVISENPVDTGRDWVLAVEGGGEERQLLPGWQTSWEADEQVIVLQAPEDIAQAPRVQRAWLVDSLGETAFESRIQLTLVAMRPDDLESAVVRAGFPGARASDEVDPTGRKLVIELDPQSWQPQDLEQLVLRTEDQGEHSLSLRLDNEDRVRAEIAADLLDLEDADEFVELVLIDKAGNQHSERVFLPQLVCDPLAFDSVDIEGATELVAGEEWMLLSGSSLDGLALAVELSHPAELWGEFVLPGRDPIQLPRTERGTSHLIRLERSILGGELSELNGGESFQAQVRLSASDAAYLFEAEGSERRSARSPLTYKLTYRAGETVLMTLVEDSALSEDEPYYTNADSLTLDLQLATDAQGALFDVEVFAPPGAGRVDGLEGARVQNPTGRASTLYELDLPVEGEYELVVRAGLVLDAGAGEDTIPGGEQSLRVVRDSTPPSLGGLSWNLTGSVIDQLTEDSDPTWTLRLEDRSPGKLHWRIERAPSWSEVDGDELLFQRGLSGQNERTLTISPSTAWEGDGRYRLRVWAEDAAGNGTAVGDQEALAQATYEVALQPPLMRPGAIKEPSGARWTTEGEGDHHRLTVELYDPNGVEFVHATVRGPEGSGLELPFELVREGEPRDDGTETWTETREFLHTWSRADLVIEFEASDRFGNHTAELGPFTGYSFGPKREVFLNALVLEDERGEQFGAMRLVQPQQGIRYSFGGRDAQEENSAFEDAGLPRTWRGGLAFQKTFRANEIGPYYLDEDEVSCADYLRFLDAGEAGFLDSGWWPEGSDGPTRERRDELQGELEREAPDSSVTGVSWEEAWAFASWCGKRLPSMVEWEFAVRNGTEYRVYPSPRAGGESAHGMRRLSSGVAEWTSVPRNSDWAAPYDDVPDLTFLRPGELDQGWASRMEWPADFRRFFLVGGSAEQDPDEVSHFFSVGHARRDEGRSWIGFRCALDARRANELRQGDSDFLDGLRLVQQ